MPNSNSRLPQSSFLVVASLTGWQWLITFALGIWLLALTALLAGYYGRPYEYVNGVGNNMKQGS